MGVVSTLAYFKSAHVYLPAMQRGLAWSHYLRLDMARLPLPVPSLGDRLLALRAYRERCNERG